MSIVQDVECVGRLGVIVFYVAYVLLIAELKDAAGLTNIFFIATSQSRNVYIVLVGESDGKRPLGRPRRGRIILRCIFRKWDVKVWAGSSWFRIGTGGGHL